VGIGRGRGESTPPLSTNVGSELRDQRWKRTEFTYTLYLVYSLSVFLWASALHIQLPASWKIKPVLSQLN
jgi:hypothetical protein